MHRLLLLGTGWIAGHHIEEFAKVPGCSIVACVDQLITAACELDEETNPADSCM